MRIALNTSGAERGHLFQVAAYSETAQDISAPEGREVQVGKGSIRQDGRTLHDMYLFEVKKPSESKQPSDY